MRIKSTMRCIFLLIGFCLITDAQNLRDLSYGSEVYAPPISLTTSQPPSTTTKKSSFFSGIKKFFSGGSSSTAVPQPITSTTTKSGLSSVVTPPPHNVPTSNSNSQSQTSRDYVNSGHNSGVTNTRDFVNTNSVSTSSTPKPLINFSPTPSSTGRRDYVNPGNYQPHNVPSPSSNSPQSQRDYVNPATPTGPSTPANNKRDFVNPNYPNQPKPVVTSQPTLTPFLQTSSPNPVNNRRDYVNPSVSTAQSPTLPSSPTSYVPKKDDFPPLPSPSSPQVSTYGHRRPGYTTHRPSYTTQKTNELATDDELSVLSESLFSKDTNNQNKNIIVNYQGHTRSSDTDDAAPQPLLNVKNEAFESPTISKMRPLYNNYELDTTINEYVTPIERQEENDFIDAILKTQVMRHAMQFLQNKGIVTPDPRTHRELLKTIWFTMYSRGGGRIGSSAFEHVFLNEIKNGTISGLHNWIYFYEQERQGHIDYKGYIKKLDLGNKGAIVKYRFDFNGIKKPVNAMFIGTSPELEMALYTVCFQVRPDKDCPITANGSKFNMKTYTFRYRGKNLIGSAFPEI